MAICVPMRELKNTSAFVKKVVESSEPIIVTKNGYKAFIALSPEQFDALQFEASREKLHQIIAVSEAELDAGEAADVRTVLSEAKKRCGYGYREREHEN